MTGEIQAWCDRANAKCAALYPIVATGALFDEPLDFDEIAMTLLDDKFYMAAYAVAGHRERWFACVDQLPALFMGFAEAEIPDDKLMRLVVFFFRWAGRFFSPEDSRRYLADKLPFISAERINHLIHSRLRRSYDGGWEWVSLPWQW